MQKVLISTQNNKKYLDFVAGVSGNAGISQRVNQAIKDQLDKYSHVMVYGESPAVEYCKLLASTTGIFRQNLSC
jgi:adenosylmethionine-8-amino-7-oxononanoate aminotransferase